MVFLHSHGVGTARAVRIYKTYGVDAVQVMTENPYRLARDIRGIGNRQGGQAGMIDDQKIQAIAVDRAKRKVARFVRSGCGLGGNNFTQAGLGHDAMAATDFTSDSLN